MAGRLTLRLPGLLGAWPAAAGSWLGDLSLPALERLLSGARSDPVYPSGLDQFSRAQLAWLADHDTLPQKNLLFAEPVHLRADQSSLRLYGADQLALSMAEAMPLAQALNQFAAADGLQFEPLTPQRWCLLHDRQAELHCHPIIAVLGRSIDGYLPEGTEAALWRRWQNEWQMLLFDQPLNRTRQQQGKPAINGLWLSGSDQPPALPEGVQRVFSDDPVRRGQARQRGLEPSGCPVGFASLQPFLNQYCLVDLPALQRSQAYQDMESWSRLIRELEQDWFEPLWQAWRAGRVAGIGIESEAPSKTRCLRLSRPGRWQSWLGKRQPLTNWLIDEH